MIEPAGHRGDRTPPRDAAQDLPDLGSRQPTPFMRGSLLVGRTLYRCLTRVDVGPLDGLPADGPLIASWLTPAMGRAVHWMAKQEALEWPVAGLFLRANGAFGIRRGAADTEAFRLAKRVLDDGRVLGTFPEGTRSSTGSLQKAKEGVTLLAIRTGAPMLPVAVWGTERFWPRGSSFLHPGGRVHLRVGAPFVLERQALDGRRESLEEVTDRLMERIAVLLPPAYRGVYADRVADGTSRRADVASRGDGGPAEGGAAGPVA